MSPTGGAAPASVSTPRFLAAVALPGAVLMALEIVSSRMLAPVFGNSVYVWGSIIGVFLAAMSAGYVWGGRAADRRPDLASLGRLLLAAAAVQWLTLLVGREATARVGEWTGGRPAGTLLATALLFGPATLLLSTVSPYAIRVAGRDPHRLGGLAGRLYALSTFGSLAGTLAATFVLIPRLPLAAILALLVGATAVAAALALGGARRVELALAALLVAGPWWLSPRAPAGGDVLEERITPYQTLIVRDRGDWRVLESDGVFHGGVEVASGAPTHRYLEGALSAWLYQPEIRRVLALGLGSGGLGRYLDARFPGLDLTYAEIDPAVAAIARRWFGFVPGERLRLELEDGRRFLQRTTERYDLVYCDTYVGLAVPFHLTTREFFREVEARLAPGGVVAINLAASLEHPFSRAILRTLHQVFREVAIFRIPGSGNLVVLGAQEPTPVSRAELERRARSLDARRPVAPGFAEIARRRLEADVELSDVPVLTDGYAPVDALLNFADRAATPPGAAAP